MLCVLCVFCVLCVLCVCVLSARVSIATFAERDDKAWLVLAFFSNTRICLMGGEVEAVRPWRRKKTTRGIQGRDQGVANKSLVWCHQELNLCGGPGAKHSEAARKDQRKGAVFLTLATHYKDTTAS